MAYKDIEVQRARDRERFRKRTAERIAAGLCPLCGDRPPAPERSACDPCAARRNKASRARDARLRAEGKPRRDPVKSRAYERGRSRQERERRSALGLCTRCGEAPAAPDRASCEPCLEKRRASDRAKYAAGKTAGLPYGGANADAKRRAARARGKRRQGGVARGRPLRPLRATILRRSRAASTLHSPCQPEAPGGEGAPQIRGERRDAGLCVPSCGEPRLLAARRYCGPCAAIERRPAARRSCKNAQARRRYARRKAAGVCTDCGAPSQGAAVAVHPVLGAFLSPLGRISRASRCGTRAGR